MSEQDNDQGLVEGQQVVASTLPCAQCGAELEFVPGSQTLKCGHCGHTQTITINGGVVEYDLNDAMNRFLGQAAAPPPSGVRQVKCEDCSAEVVVPDGEETVRCDYCGSRKTIKVEMPHQVLRPESLLPFAFDSKAAEEKFRAWIKGLWFRPNALKQRHSVDELHGVYVPYWTYDCHVASYWTAQSGYHYYVTQTYRSQGRTHTRQVRRTRWVWTNGQRRDFFDDWLVCASLQLRNRLAKLLAKIEPFPTKALVPYNPSFLSGFRAERYSVDLKQGWEIARNGIYSEVTSRCSRDVPGDTQRFLNVRATYYGQSFKHVLLPIFILAYRYQNKVFNVLINGSTGVVKGQAPLSWVKITLLILGILAVLGGGFAIYWYALGGNQTAG